jgi:hypothetical protein
VVESGHNGLERDRQYRRRIQNQEIVGQGEWRN